MTIDKRVYCFAFLNCGVRGVEGAAPYNRVPDCLVPELEESRSMPIASGAEPRRTGARRNGGKFVWGHGGQIAGAAD